MKNKITKLLILGILTISMIIPLTGCGSTTMAATEENFTNQGLEPSNNVLTIPKDVDLEVVDVREMFATNSYGSYHPFAYYTINVILKDTNGERYVLYYTQRDVTYLAEEGFLGNNYVSLAKLVPGDYIRYDSIKDTLLFSYQ